MKRKTMTEAQTQLRDLLEAARDQCEPVMLTDERGSSFLRFIEARFAAAKSGRSLSLEQVKEELAKLED